MREFAQSHFLMQKYQNYQFSFLSSNIKPNLEMVTQTPLSDVKEIPDTI